MMEVLPRPATKDCTKKIINQMNSSFCYFTRKNNTYDIGYFCRINYQNKYIPVVIINNHSIDDNYNYILNASLNNTNITLELDNTRYKNVEDNLSILEIKENKKHNFNFLEIDDKLYEKDSEMFYEKESIYIIQSQNKEEMSVSYGVVNETLIDNKLQFIYSSYINKDSKHSLIFNLSNNKLLGIHKSKSKIYNKGIFLNRIIKEFIDIYNYNQKANNEINIEINVNKSDIHQNIYFLDYYENEYSDHVSLKPLNETNTELYINDRKYRYKKFFKAEKEGKYKIKLKFKINLINLSYMFSGCEKILDVNFVFFNTKYINNMNGMFYGCKNLKTINCFSLNTENIIDMSYMFYDCNSLTRLDLSSFDTNKVIYMNKIFCKCNNLKEIFSNKKGIYILLEVEKDDIGNKIYFLGKKYNELNKLNTELYINNNKNEFHRYFIPVKEGKYNIKLEFNIFLYDLSYMFSNCVNILDINFISINIKLIKNIKYMFYGCKRLLTFNLSSFDTSNVSDMSYMFYDCNNLYNLDISSLETKKATNMSFMFSNCYSLKILSLSSFETKSVTNMRSMFSGCKSLEILDLSTFETKNVTNMSSMFSGCHKIKTLDLSSFDTKNVTNMNSMFSSCKSLNNLILTSFDTKKVTNMAEMFYDCNSLKKFDLSSFCTTNVIDMSNMFSICTKLNNLDLSSFDTKNVRNMSSMFSDCNSLKSLNISSFITENVTDMSSMFSGCIELNNLDLSSFDTKGVKNMKYMFSDCNYLFNVNISNFNINNTCKLEGIFYNSNENILNNNSSIFKKFDKRILTQHFLDNDQAFYMESGKIFQIYK